MNDINRITQSGDALEFEFGAHEAALRERISAWFEEKIGTATPTERRNLARNCLVNGASLGRELGRCRFSLSFQRTLRVPDDGREYPLPAGLGELPLANVRLLKSGAIPPDWRGRPVGLIALYPAEALWLSFGGSTFAVQISAGKVCAVSGREQTAHLVREPQNYVVTPSQPWLDGFRVGPETVRQFVAMPLGKGFTVEGQVTGVEKIGGMQLRVVPPTFDFLWENSCRPACESRWRWAVREPLDASEASNIQYCRLGEAKLGFGAGGRIRQKIYADPHPAGTWDEASALACEMKLIDARRWTEFTGRTMPTPPPTPEQYARAGIPWFDYENGAATLTDAAPLAEVRSVAAIHAEKTGLPLPGNDSIEVGETILLGGATASAKPGHQL